MSDFKAKMQQIRFRLALRPRPRWGSLQHSPDPLAGFRGPTSKGGGEAAKGGEGSTPPRFCWSDATASCSAEKGEVCFTVSDVGGGWSPTHGGGLDAPAPGLKFVMVI